MTISAVPTSGSASLTVNFSSGKNQVVPLDKVPTPDHLQFTDISRLTDTYYMITCAWNDYVYFSTDSGATWVKQTAAGINDGVPGTPVPRQWQACAADLNGHNLLACVKNSSVEGYIWVSNDYSSTWTKVGPKKNWQDIAISGSGQYAIAVTDSGEIWTSNNFGATWVNAISLGVSINSVEISYDGQVAICFVYNSTVYISLDRGLTWAGQAPLGSTTCCAISVVGGIYRFYIGTYNNYIKYCESDGITIGSWNNLTAAGSRNWITIAISSRSFLGIVAVTFTGVIYLSVDQGASFTSYNSSIIIKRISLAQVSGTLQHLRYIVEYEPNVHDLYSSTYYSSFVWNFGDGRQAYVQNPTHIYGSGLFTVQLSIDVLPPEIITDYITVTPTTNTVTIVNGLIKSWTKTGVGSKPVTPNTHTVVVNNGMIESWSISPVGTRGVSHENSVNISNGLIQSWTQT
jgi:hypothetical protein